MLNRLLLAATGGSGAFPAPPGITQIAPAPYGIGTDIQWPMAIEGNGKVYIGIVQGETDPNDIGIMAWDYATDTLEGPIALIDQLSGGSSTVPDTHNQPAVAILGDGRLIAAYCAHSSTTMRIKVSNDPWDITAGFGSQISFSSTFAMTYPQLAVMDTGRIFIRYRAVGSGVARIGQRFSDDDGATWSSELLFYSGSTNNIYSAFACDGTWVDQVLIPRAPDYASGWPMLHVRMDATGDVFTTDGVEITGFSYPLATAQLTQVFADGSYRYPRGIVYDSGTPLIAWDSAQADPVLMGESRWNGSAWVATTILTSTRVYDAASSTGGGKHSWDATEFAAGKTLGTAPIDLGGSIEIFRSRRSGGSWDAAAQITNAGLNPYAPITVVNGTELKFLWPFGDQAPADGDPFSLGTQGI